jgi:hypothetical protein
VFTEDGIEEAIIDIDDDCQRGLEKADRIRSGCEKPG